MNTFIMLTRINSDTSRTPQMLEDLEKQVMTQIQSQCPKVQWVHNYAILGPYEYLDIFTAPDIETATKVATIVRTYGCASSEIWPATEWNKFKKMIHKMPHAA